MDLDVELKAPKPEGADGRKSNTKKIGERLHRLSLAASRGRGRGGAEALFLWQ